MKVLSICGSPRRGNSETILLEMQKLFQKRGIDNEIILLRQKNINRCHGCVEVCNPKGICCQKDDVEEILDKWLDSDALVIISPNYFQMPPGLLKDFMDRSCIMFASKRDQKLISKKAVVITVGTDKPEKSLVCAQNIANLYLQYSAQVVATKAFKTKSELKGNYNDVFENGFNPKIKKDLSILVDALVK